jgi:hypothetical protein
MIEVPRNHVLGAALLVAGLPMLSLASGNSNQSDQTPKSAEEVFDSLVRRGEPGMTQAEAEEYLRKYDPKYSDPDLLEYAKSHPDFREFQNRNLARDAKRLVEIEGTDVTGTGRKVLTKKRFVQVTTKPPATLTKAPPPDYLSNLTGGVLKNANLSVTKSTTIQGDEKRPAQFGWTYSNTDSFFTIDGALTYKFDNISGWQFSEDQYLQPILNFSVEAHTTTQAPSKRQQDSISAKIPVELDISTLNDDSWIRLNTFLITPSYERDRKKTIETYGVNVLWSPTISPPTNGPIMLIRTGQFIPLSQILPGYPFDYPGIVWRPYVGFESGDRTTSDPKDKDAAKAYDGQPEYSRFVVTTHADVYITPNFDIAIDFSHRTFLTGSELSFDFIDISPILYLDGTPDDPNTQHLSLGLTYKNGKTTPQFKDVMSISAWIGVKF